MKKMILGLGLLFCMLTFGVVAQGAQGQKRIKGYLYGVFEVEDNKELANRMSKVGFQVLKPTVLNKIGLADEVKFGYRYFYVPFQNMIVEVGQKKARTIWNGSFTLHGVDLSSEKWSVKTTVDEEPITSSRWVF